jgi:hypothetical protein
MAMAAMAEKWRHLKSAGIGIIASSVWRSWRQRNRKSIKRIMAAISMAKNGIGGNNQRQHRVSENSAQRGEEWWRKRRMAAAK